MLTTNKIETEKPGKRQSVDGFLVKYGLAFFALMCVIVFSILEPKFLGVTNLFNIITSASVMGVTAMGLTLVMSSGEIDFAVGMELTIAAVVLGWLLDSRIVESYPLAVILTLVALAIFGLINAFLHIKVGIPAFIATMGTSLIAQGIAYLWTDGMYVNSQRWPDEFTLIGQGFVFKIIPIMAIFLIVLSIIIWVYTELTNNGKTLYAVGSNVNACNYVGIDPRKEKLKGFVIGALLCGIGGVMLSSQLNRAGPEMGESTLENGLTAIMLGATFLRPGVFNIPGTILGALIVVILSNGFTMISAPAYARDLIMALVMIVAVTAVTVLRKRTEKIN